MPTNAEYVADALAHGVSQQEIDFFLAGNVNPNGTVDYHRLWTLYDVGGVTSEGVGFPIGTSRFNQAISGAPSIPFNQLVLQAAIDEQAITQIPEADYDTFAVSGEIQAQAIAIPSVPSMLMAPNGTVDWGKLLIIAGVIVVVVISLREMRQ